MTGIPATDHQDTGRRAFLKMLTAGTAMAVLPGFATNPRISGATPVRGALGFQNAPQKPFSDIQMTLIHGRPPQDIEGVFYRNGPGQMRRGADTIGHWFDGDGFIRAYRLTDGKLSLSGRFVETPKRSMDEKYGRFVTAGFGNVGDPDIRVSSPDDNNAANTSLLAVEDMLWALWEAGSPTELNPGSLATKGQLTLGEGLAHMPFSAHPKVDPDGSIWNFGIAFGRPFAFLWHLRADGSVKKSRVVRLPATAYMHDWVVTETKVILPLQPWIMDGEGESFAARLRWHKDQPIRYMVLEKSDFSTVGIYEAPAAFLFHTGNGWEDADGTLYFDACISSEPTLDAVRGAKLAAGEPFARKMPRMSLVTIEKSGRVTTESTAHHAEFPQVDPRNRTRNQGQVWSAVRAEPTPAASFLYDGIMRTDWASGAQDRFHFGDDHIVEEHLFVPGKGQAGGWLLGSSLNLKAEASEFHIFRADRISDGPVATWRAPLPLPVGLHAVWV
ncbi:MAG: carotenoid oxygenase family protein [Pseudomonadota bacterium]